MKNGTEKGGKPPSAKGVPGEKKSPGRSERLAKALRENLRKRKAQARGRAKG